MEQHLRINPTRTVEWLNKLIMLAQWDKKLPFHIVRLLKEPEDYQEFLTRVRASLKDKAQLTDNSTANTPVVTARKKLLEAVAAVATLQELFSSDQDPFDGAPPEHLQLLAEVSDMTTEPSQKMVYSRNGTLVAVVEAMRQSQDFNPEPLIVDGLNKFFTLLETDNATAKMLYDLAVSPHWYVVMAWLRSDRDYTRDEDAPVAAALAQWNAKMTEELEKILLNPGHLSRAPKKVIRLGWEHRKLFAEARASIRPNEREKDPVDERRQVANAAFLLFEEKAKEQCEEIKAELNVFAVVARHFINVRKFAKFDGFVYTWPEIARLGMANYAALKYVEDLLLNRKPRPSDADLDAVQARDLYELCEKNDRFIRFLRLRPHFGEISQKELMRYRPLEPVRVTETPGTSASRAAEFTAPQPPAPPPPIKGFEVRTLYIERVANAPFKSEGVTYSVSLPTPGSRVVYSPEIAFSVEKLLQKMLAAMGVSSDGALQDVLKQLFLSGLSFAEERMWHGSNMLAVNILPFGARAQLTELLQQDTALRLVIKSPETEVQYLPWEWWPGSSSRLLLSSGDHSVVRGFNPDTENPAPLIAPLRLMSIMPTAPKGRLFLSDITIKALDEVASAHGARYRPLIREDATLKNLQYALDAVKPHVVHFEGYVNISDAEHVDEGLRIVLSEPDADGINLKEFGALLKSNGVQLLVIGRNGVSRIYENPGATAAFLLANQGLSIIAPMRAIDDASATTFTTEFYRAFLQGNTLESALRLARRALVSKGGDWSVFALFADPSRLDNFQLIRETA